MAQATRRLVRLDYDSERMPEIYRPIGWLAQLPPEGDAGIAQQLAQEEGEARYVPSLERYYQAQGLRKGIDAVLEVRFGAAGASLQAELAEIHDPAILRAVLARLKTAQTVDEVRAVYRTTG